MHAEPPVADLVAEPLDDDRAVVGRAAGRLLLLVQVSDQVGGGPLVQAGLARSVGCFLGPQAPEFTDEGAERPAQFKGPAGAVSMPEGQASGKPRGRVDEHPVVSDLADAPARRAEHDHIAGAGLVDHFLVELAHPGGPLGTGQEDTEQAPVGNRASTGDGQALGARPRSEQVASSVPGDPWPQLGEVVGGIAAGEHVQRRLQGAGGQVLEWRGPAYEDGKVVHGPLVDREHRDNLLSQDIQWVARDMQGLDLARAHALRDDGGREEVAAVLGEDDAAAHFPDRVTRAAHALQPARHARRRLHLHREINRPHVDAQLEGGRGDNSGEPPGLELILDEGALCAADTAVVRAGDLDRRGPTDAAQPYDPGGHTGLGQLCARALGGQLVETAAQPFGAAPRVGEDERRGMAGYEVENPAFDRGPDRGAGRGLAGLGRGESSLLGQGRHVFDGHLDLDLDRLLGRRRNDRHGSSATKEPGYLGHGPDRGRQPDALRGPFQQNVESFQADREVGTALVARDRVHLVEDHRFDTE